MSRLSVTFTEQQVQLIERLASEWHLSPAQAVGVATRKCLAGEDEPPPAAPPAETVPVDVGPGQPRLSLVLEPVSGKALPVYAGEVLRISQIDGGQCVDFNAFNLHDYKEHMAAGHSRIAGFRLGQGNTLFTNPPHFRPLLHISHMPATCVTDTLAPRCHTVLYERQFGFQFHTNCQDTIAEAIREFGLTPDDVHDSFNMFMNTGWDARGRWWIEWNTGQAGDHVDLLACIDTLAVPVVCGSGDVQLTSNFFLKPVQVAVFGATGASREAAAAVNARYAARTRKTVADYRVRQIREERELRADPDYVPAYASFPLRFATLEVDLGPEDEAAVDSLVAEGFGGDRADVVRRLFMIWYLRNRTAQGDMVADAFVGGLRM